MKLKIKTSELLSLLSKTQNIVEKRNAMPVLSNVLLECSNNLLTIFATDLEVSLTDSVKAEVIESGKVAVNAKSLFDIAKELPEEEVLLTKQENNWLKIAQSKSVFNIVGISPEEYPVFPSIHTKKFSLVSSQTLSEMISKTIYSVSHDQTRYHLNGVYLEKDEEHQGYYRMVATDGHRLSLVNRKMESSSKNSLSGVIIPKKGLNEINKLIEGIQDNFEMAIEGAQLIVRYNSTVLMVRLIEGKYPNYNQLIPKDLKQKILVDKALLHSSLKRVSLMSNQKSKGVTFKLSDGKMEITSNNPEMGEAKEEIDIDYKGNDFKIGFNAKYILDILNSIDDSKISIELSDQLSPGIMRPQGDESYTCVVMPMRI
ncbi:MAG: DNA polymerase III subunit beta [Bdellovibrionales bacterium]|nr:DNA polymerase III subunit beta [Bdellovibrionales bacterium]MCB0412865.1 DNA polymerase III subunit beta [Bdellovibrionales bacterium]